MTFEYDDRKLQELFGEMDEKHRLKALKGAFRAEGNKVRKIAVGNLRSKMRSNRKLETCIRVVVSKKKPQFTVTASPKGRLTMSGKYGGRRQVKGYYTNRRGVSVPVLVWAEDGTKPRYTRRTAGNRGGWLSGLDPMSRKRLRSKSSKGAYRGRMPAMGFMARAKVQAAPQVTDGLHEAVRAYTVKTAKKYGCKIT